MVDQPDQPSAGTLTRVLCVDDNADLNLILSRLIDQDPTLECVGCLESADAMLEVMARAAPRPDVIVLDATMPGREPIQAMAELAARYPATRTIVFSAHDDEPFLQRARGAGAWGCVGKDDEPDAILRAVRAVAAGRPCWPGRGAQRKL